MDSGNGYAFWFTHVINLFDSFRLGWDQTKWPSTEFPMSVSKSILKSKFDIFHLFQTDFDNEPLLVGRPIVMRRVDGHALWVSSKVIEETGELPDHVEGGEIIRDDDGKATGRSIRNIEFTFCLINEYGY